jgi:hypothetical protein
VTLALSGCGTTSSMHPILELVAVGAPASKEKNQVRSYVELTTRTFINMGDNNEDYGVTSNIKQ